MALVGAAAAVTIGLLMGTKTGEPAVPDYFLVNDSTEWDEYKDYSISTSTASFTRWRDGSTLMACFDECMSRGSGCNAILFWENSSRTNDGTYPICELFSGTIQTNYYSPGSQRATTFVKDDD